MYEPTSDIIFTLNADDLRYYLESFVYVEDVIRLKLSREDMETIVVDRKQISEIRMTLKRKAFTRFKGAGSDLILPVRQVFDVVRTFPDDSELTLESKERSERFSIKTDWGFHWDAPYPDVNPEAHMMLDLDFECEAEVNIHDIHDAISTIRRTVEPENILLTIHGEGITLSGEEDDEKVSISIPKEKIRNLSAEKETSSLFELERMAQILRAMQDSDYARLQLKQDYPFRISTSFAEGNGEASASMAPLGEEE